MMLNYIFLALATVAEVLGTSALKASHGFTHGVPTIVVVVAYCLTFYFLGLSLRTIPLSIAYAIWCGGGIALVAAIDFFYFRQPLDLAVIVGLMLIGAGVVVVSLFSKTAVH